MKSTLPIVLSLTLLFLGRASAQLHEIRAAMNAEVSAGHAAGVVTLVMKDGKVAHHEAAGFADLENRVPMKKDAVFWIASMSKSITATTILTLVDEGKLSLDEPAAKWLPEVGKVKLANGQPPQRPITLRDLMSHTSGLAFPPRKANDGAQSLATYVPQLLRDPLEFEPGSAYRYGFGLTVAGRIAEIVSGKSFERLMRERILEPLGMSDTAFNPPDRLRARIPFSYKTVGDDLVIAYNPFHTSDSRVPRMIEPSGGLFSTASDMATFYQMILAGGVHAGRRIVSASAIKEMTRPHQAGGKTLNYGLGWMCNHAEKSMIRDFSDRAFGHGGAYATHGWVDTKNGTVAVLMVQNVMVKGSGELRKAFHDKVTATFER